MNAKDDDNTRFGSPLCDVVGLSRSHGQRAVRWLRNHRSMLAFFDTKTDTLRAPQTKYGAEHTYEQMHAAIDATDRRGR